MAGQSSAMIAWSWTDVSVLGSQVFGEALMDSSDRNGHKQTETDRNWQKWTETRQKRTETEIEAKFSQV